MKTAQELTLRELIENGHITITDEDVQFTRCDLIGEMSNCYSCTVELDGVEADCDINKYDAANLVNGDY